MVIMPGRQVTTIFEFFDWSQDMNLVGTCSIKSIRAQPRIIVGCHLLAPTVEFNTAFIDFIGYRHLK